MNAVAPADPHDIYRLACLRELLAAHGVRLKQSLGQNFLHDRNVIEKMVRSAGIQRDDTVLEIGAGIGHLTIALAQAAARVVAVETDARLLPLVRGICAAYANITVIHADILAMPLAAFCSRHRVQPQVIAANLPYYITTPLVEQIVTSGLPLRSATFTVQQEAAERLAALPGQRGYGLAAVLLRLWGLPHIGAAIAPACFFPRPRVRSRLLHIQAHHPPQLPAVLVPVLHDLLHHAFNQRRKTLANALASVVRDQRRVLELLSAAGLDARVRAEAVTPAGFARVAECAVALNIAAWVTAVQNRL